MSNDQYMYGYPIQSKAGIATKIFSLKQNSIFYSTGINYPILLNEHMLILPCTKLNYRETNKQQKWKVAIGSATKVSIQQ